VNDTHDAASAAEEWYRHYGFDRDPFGEGGVHGLFYPGGARQELVEQLQHLARFSDCVLLVTGSPGAGKTATRRHFVAQCAADTRCCVVEASLLEGPEQWLRRVLEGFGQNGSNPPELEADLGLLANYCSARQAAGARCWLVVDDAQHLHQDVLDVLPQLLQSAGGSLRLVFFAEPAWREHLQAVMPHGLPLHTIELQPFDQGETFAYLHYRLSTAGLEGEPPFNAAEFERIHRQAGGLPGRINTLAREVLVDALEVVQQPLSTLPLWHFGVIAATLLALLLLYLWGAIDEDKPVPRPAQTPELARPDSEAPGTLQIAPESQTAAPADSTEPPPAQSAPAPQPSEPVAGSPVPVEADDMALPEGDIEDTVVEAPAGEVLPDAATASASPQPATAAESVAAQPPVPEQPSTASYVYRAEGRVGGTPTADEEQLLGMPPTHFVLQIMGSDDAARVRSFAARSRASLRLYRKLHNGREWYALVYGDYPDRASAERAVAALPRELSGMRPWVRRLDAIQGEIRAARSP
jgi:DamX protein